MKPLCLHCRLWDVTPDAVAGLCVSCAWSVRFRWCYPVPDGAGVALALSRAQPSNPLGWEGTGPVPVYPFDPRQLLGPDATAADVAAVNGQLLALARGPAVSSRHAARKLVDAIRELGCTIYVDSGMGHPILSEPERLPFGVMLEYVRLLTWVEDVLTRERSRELRDEREKRLAMLRERYGASWPAEVDELAEQVAAAEFVQIEQNSEMGLPT